MNIYFNKGKNMDFSTKQSNLNIELGATKLENSKKYIEVSSNEPTDPDVILWYEITPNADLNEFFIENNDSESEVHYG